MGRCYNHPRDGWYFCMSCDGDGEGPMLRDEVWARINKGNQRGFMCLLCMEHALGRRIIASDMTQVPMNDRMFIMLDRIAEIERANTQCAPGAA